MINLTYAQKRTKVPVEHISELKPVYKRRILSWLNNNHWMTHKFCISCKNIYSLNCFKIDHNQEDKRFDICNECAARGVANE